MSKLKLTSNTGKTVTIDADNLLEDNQLDINNFQVIADDMATLKAMQPMKDGATFRQKDIDLLYVYEAANVEADNGGTILALDNAVGRLVAQDRVIYSPNNTAYKIVVDDSGNLAATVV